MIAAWVASHLLASSCLLASTPEVESTPTHQVGLYGRMGFAGFSSSARTQAGIGGGVGVRDVLHGQWLLQADVSGLVGLGGLLEVRLGAGWQRPGFWSPSARLELSALLGQQVGFVRPGSESLPGSFTAALGAVLAPVRFSLSGACVSVLEVSVGAGPDPRGWGLRLGLTLLEIGTTF